MYNKIIFIYFYYLYKVEKKKFVDKFIDYY